MFIDAAAGALPILTLFALLAWGRLATWVCAVISLGVAIIVAATAFQMPTHLAFLAASQGAAFGVFPIMWIFIMAMWFYRTTSIGGADTNLQRIFTAIGRGDSLIPALLITICLGELLEALAGFGSPVAICTVMLIGLKFSPLRAALAALVANTTPVAFAAMGIGITTAGTILSGPDKALNAQQVAWSVATMVPPISVIMPLTILFILGGWSGVKRLLPLALVVGAADGVTQWAIASYGPFELASLLACLVSFAAGLGLLRIWHPSSTAFLASGAPEGLGPQTAAPAAPVAGTEQKPQLPAQTAAQPDLAASPLPPLTTRAAITAVAPYMLVVAVLFVGRVIGPLRELLARGDIKIPWPGLYGQLMDAKGQVSSSPIFTLNLLSSPGTALAICTLATAVFLSTVKAGKFTLGLGQALRLLGETLWKLRFTSATIVAVLALAYVMNMSGQTLAIGSFLAGVGAAFPLISPLIGFLGTAITGSAASANALFTSVQEAAAGHIGMAPHAAAAANMAGGVIGKMVAPQNLAIAASAMGETGKGAESLLLKKVAPWAAGLMVLATAIVAAQTMF